MYFVIILLRMLEGPAENGIPEILDCAYAHGSVVIKEGTKRRTTAGK